MANDEPSWKEIVDEILPRIWVREAGTWEHAIMLGRRFGLTAAAIREIEAGAERDMAGLALATQKLKELLVKGQLADQVDLAPIRNAMAELRQS